MQFRARAKLVFRRHRDSQVGGSRPRRWRGARGMSFPSPLPPAPATIYFRDDSSHLHVYSGCLDTYHFRASTKSVPRRLRDSQVGELENTATGRAGGESPYSPHDFPRPLSFSIGHPPQTYACVRGRCAYIQPRGSQLGKVENTPPRGAPGGFPRYPHASPRPPQSARWPRQKRPTGKICRPRSRVKDPPLRRGAFGAGVELKRIPEKLKGRAVEFLARP